MAKSNTPAVAAPSGGLTADAQAAVDKFRNAVVSLMADDSQATEQMIARLMSANSVDAILDAEPEDEAGTTEGKATHLADIIGKVFTITAVELRESDIEGSSLPCYAVMHTEEYGVVTSGATQVVVALVAMKMKETDTGTSVFPVQVVGFERGTKKGNTVRWLQRPSNKRVAEQQALALEQSKPF